MEYVCKKCGDCCRAFELTVLPTEAERIVVAIEKAYGISFNKVYGASVRVYGTCLAYDEKLKRCKIYKSRSQRCKDFYCGRHEIKRESRR